MDLNRKGWIATVILLFSLPGTVSLFAQIPTASFAIPTQACLNQNILPDNASSNATHYEWDFCQGDLALTPTVASLGAAGGVITMGVDVVTDGANWYGFVTSRETGAIIRLDFGNDYTNTPVKTNLGDFGGALGRPIDIKVVRDNGNWYGFVYSEATSVSLISRINFGTSLQNTTSSPTPITTNVILPGNGIFNSNGGFDMVPSGTGWVIAYTQPMSVNLLQLTSITSIPTATDQLATATFPGVAANTLLGDIKLVRSSGQWYGYTSDSQNTQLYRLSFGATAFSMPSITNLGGSFFKSPYPFGLDIGVDNGDFYMLAPTAFGNLLRVNLGSDLSAAPVSGINLGTLGALSFTYKLKLINHASQWVAFTTDYTNSNVFRIAFPTASCATAPSSSTNANPAFVYTAAGNSYVTLHAFNTDGNEDQASALITVLSGIAPVFNFTSQNSCAQFPVNFTVQNAQPLTNYQWDFGNTGTSTQPSPSETFATAGNFSVSLTAMGANGCSNLVRKIIPVYNAPVADFTLPSPALSCTNQQYDFPNTSVIDVASTPTWQWNVNGALVSSTKDLAYAFATTASQTIQLVASLPGCATEKTQSFTIQQQGPVVDFNFGVACESQSLAFTNTSVGNITGYSWNFGDGTSTSTTAPSHSYGVIGKYDVTLTVTNPLGCNNYTSKPLTVFSTPQPAFALELPPFSCSGTPSQLNDETPNMTDSNISSWSWDPGDGTPVLTDQNPVHTFTDAGMYLVSLTVTTDRGCSAVVQDQITISPSPSINFTNTPACLNHETQFEDTSDAGIKSWTWNVDGTFSTEQNPKVTFHTSGSHSVQLTATGSNDCIGHLSKTIAVPVAPAISFSTANPCKDSPTIFTDTTSPGGDAISMVSWDFMSNGVHTDTQGEFTYTDTGIFNATMIATGATGCVYTQTNSLEIFDPPLARFSVAKDSGAAPFSVPFLNQSAAAESYHWDFGSAQSTESNPVHVFDTKGVYDVLLVATNTHGCSDTTSHTITVTEKVIEQMFAPWPNPASSDLYFGWVSYDNSDLTYRLTTVQGQVVREFIVSSTVGYNVGLDDVRNLTPGIYLLTLRRAAIVQTFRLQVE